MINMIDLTKVSFSKPRDYSRRTSSVADEIADCFVGVLTRPSIGATCYELISPTFIRYEIKHMGTTYQMFVDNRNSTVNVSVHSTTHIGKCFFNVSFSKAKLSKVKKQALILAQKMKMKPVYDVMRT